MSQILLVTFSIISSPCHQRSYLLFKILIPALIRQVFKDNPAIFFFIFLH